MSDLGTALQASLERQAREKVAACPECGKPQPCFVERVLRDQAIDRIRELLVDADNEWFKGVASDDRWGFLAARVAEWISTVETEQRR